MDKAAQARHLGKVLSEAREDLGLDQIDIATAAGCPVTAYSKYENGRVLPEIPRIVALLRTLGEDPCSVLLELAGDKPRRKRAKK